MPTKTVTVYSLKQDNKEIVRIEAEVPDWLPVKPKIEKAVLRSVVAAAVSKVKPGRKKRVPTVPAVVTEAA